MNKYFLRFSLFAFSLFIISAATLAQVSSVEFGKNRVQYQKFNWKYYQTENFNTYFSQDGLEIGKYVAQVAEQELPQLEEFVEYGLQRRANLIVYNNFDELQQSNVGLGIDWQNTGGVTKLVNNKMLVYFDADRNNLRRQVRQGIAQVLFNGSVGRTDLPGGSFDALQQSIKTKMYMLPEDVIVYPGHGDSTTIGDEMKTNPFVKME
jgi:hypothetical protein